MNSNMELKQFLRLLLKGGTIVCSSECTEFELNIAKACNRFFVDDEGFGYVYRPEKNEL